MPLVLALCALFLVSGPAARGQAQNGWRKIGALRDAKGDEPVRVRVDRAESRMLELTYAMPGAKSAKSGRRINGKDSELILLGNAPRTGRAGQPVLPVVPARILLPEGYTVDSIQVTSRGKTRLPGTHDVEYGEKPFPLLPGVRPEKARPDPAVYNSSNPYPGRLYDVLGIQKQRGSAVLLLALHPVEYVPATGELSSYGELLVRVTLKRDASGGAVRHRADARRPVAATVDNPDTAATYSESREEESNPAKLAFVDPADTYSYVIVTSEEMKDATGPYSLTNLLAHKQSRGLTATIVTTTNIYLNYTGADNAEKVRNFIIDAYNNWETDYVLLAGDIGVVPMRKLRCQAYPGGDIDDLPSDLYYQCLDGPYNNDGDSYWGEPTDGTGGGDVDLVAEVYIGRASAQDTNEMENFVFKTMAYENESETAEYLHTALMCGEHLGFGGISEYAWPSMEEIRYGSSTNGYTTAGFTNSPLFTVETLYDTATNTWAKDDLLNLFNSGRYSIINHLGHANYNYVMKFYNADADGLTNNNFLFAYSQGCIPGNFEADCVAEHLTTSTRHGMYAVVFNSRYGWGQFNSTDGPSQRFDRQFWDAYFGEKMISIGELNADSHEDNLWDINGECIRWCYYESNLLGDPQTPMRGQFIADAILMTPQAGFLSSGAEGGPFDPGSQVYYLFSTATNGGVLDWTASCTSSWVTLSATNGSLGENGHASFTLTINTNAEALAEGGYADTLVFLNTTSGKGSTTQSVILVVNNPPRVSGISIQDGDGIAAGDTTITIEFDQAMETTTLDQADFDLLGTIGGHRAPTSWAFDPVARELTLDYDGLPDDQYTLTLFSGSGQFEDEDGFSLDGETPLWPIPPRQSGDGVAGGNFSMSFTADAGTLPYGRTLTPKVPLGSLIYDPTVSAYLSSAADEDRFTIEFDAGQVVTVVVDPESTLQPVVRLFDPFGVEIGSATSSASGAEAVLQTVGAPVAGLYAVAVSGVAGTGMYTVQVVLNAAEEDEAHGGPTNDTIEVAQDLDAGFVSISGGVSRAAVLGYAARGELETVYEQTFEGGLGGFTTDNTYGSGNGLWHLSAGRRNTAGHTPTSSVYYGQNEGADGGGDYDNGYANGGAILSPPISLPDSDDLTLSFNMFSETEGSRSWDVCGLDVNPGSGFGQLLSSANGSLPTGTGGVWTNMTASLGSYRGTNVSLRFRFDTFDNVLNGYEGWYVDDVRITTYAEGLPDYYAFSLADGETATLILTVIGNGTAGLTLCDGAGTTLADGSGGAGNVTKAVRNFVAPSAGTYYARVAGRNQAYSLLVIRGSDFDLEPNHPLAAAQAISGRLTVLGSLAASPLDSEVEPNDNGETGSVTFDIPFANDISGSFLQTQADVYEATVAGVISTGHESEVDLFKFYASPGDTVSARVDCAFLNYGDLKLFSESGVLLRQNAFDAFLSYTNFYYAGDYYLWITASGAASGRYSLAAALVTTNLRYGAEDDHYSFSATPGDLLTVRTFTPGDGPGEFRNELNPAAELYSPEGELVASNNNGAADGRNVLLSYRALMDGEYTARLRAEDGVSGEYVFQVERESGPVLVTFGSGSVFGFETGSVIVLPVRLTGATTETVTVNYGVVGGTAIGGGTDYTLVPGTLAFPPGVTETSLAISVVNDSSSEGTETILVALSNAVNALPGRYPTNQVVIIDDENPLRIQFSAADYGAQETDGSAVITVVRAGGSHGRITADYAATSGTAEAGTDYAPVTGTVTIADGAAGTTFSVWVAFDVIEEGDETVDLGLRNAGGGAVLGNPSNAALTIHDYDYPRTNMLRNCGFETPTDTNEFDDGWWAYGDSTREDWAAHSGNRGGNLQGWIAYTYAWFNQEVDVPRGTYTFSLWVRRETGFNPLYVDLYIQWYDDEWNLLQPDTLSSDLESVIPGDGGWHQIHVTGSCADPYLDHVRVGFESYWSGPTGSPSGFQFDDAALCGGSYTGVPALANGGFEEGLSSGDKWRGSSWYATPENRANSRETWAWHGGSWGGALYGWDTASNRYTTTIAQNLMPGTGTYTLAFWLLREPGFLLTNAELRIGWYGSNFTGKVQSDSVTNVAVPNDNAWHEYYLTGTCTNRNVFEVRPQLFVQHLLNTTGGINRGFKFDDARFVRGIPDSDGDGLPDPWENAYFGGATSASPGIDSDGDTFDNWQEFLADSNPKEIGSCLEIVCFTNQGARCLSFLCSPQRCYDIEFTTNLLGTGWQTLQSNVPGGPGVLSVNDTNMAAGFRLYRVNLCPP